MKPRPVKSFTTGLLDELQLNSIVTHEFLSTLSNAFSKSMKFMYSGVCHSVDCSMIILIDAINDQYKIYLS